MVILPAALALLLASPQSLTETIEVRLHTVDVVVTNTGGEPVTGLRADDFEILEDGVPQTVTNFSAFSETAATPAAQPESEQAPSRTFVFFIDEMGLVGSTRDDLLANLRAFTANFREGDRAAVVRPSEATTIALKLTSDRQVIERDLEAALSDSVIKGRRVGLAGDYYWYQRDKQMAMGSNAVRTVTRRAAARTTQRVKQRLGTIRAIIATLAPIEGRKVLI
ncbi:MAG TPA: VWA domain-containing protein, partial [Thermoanaerobaculia bacterium]